MMESHHHFFPDEITECVERHVDHCWWRGVWAGTTEKCCCSVSVLLASFAGVCYSTVVMAMLTCAMLHACPVLLCLM